MKNLFCFDVSIKKRCLTLVDITIFYPGNGKLVLVFNFKLVPDNFKR